MLCLTSAKSWVYPVFDMKRLDCDGQVKKKFGQNQQSHKISFLEMDNSHQTVYERT